MKRTDLGEKGWRALIFGPAEMLAEVTEVIAEKWLTGRTIYVHREPSFGGGVVAFSGPATLREDIGPPDSFVALPTGHLCRAWRLED